MSNCIGELTNNIKSTNQTEQPKIQYQTTDNGQSFNDILTVLNNNSSKVEKNISQQSHVSTQNYNKKNSVAKEKISSSQNPHKSNKLGNKSNNFNSKQSKNDLQKTETSQSIEKNCSDENRKSQQKITEDSTKDNVIAGNTQTENKLEESSNQNVSSAANITEEQTTDINNEETTGNEIGNSSQENNQSDATIIDTAPIVVNAENLIAMSNILGTNIESQSSDNTETESDTEIEPNISIDTNENVDVETNTTNSLSKNTENQSFEQTQNTESTTFKDAQISPNREIKGVNNKETEDSQNIQIEADVTVEEAPSSQPSLVKVGEDVKSAASKTNPGLDLSPKTESKIEQSLLNSLDAQVVQNTPNSSNNGGSLFNQQNASEQVVKLAIESASDTQLNNQSADFSGLLNQKTTGMDKTLQANISTPKEISQTDILNQINDKLNNIKSNSNNKVEIILRPENLGKINVELNSVKGAVNATFVAENQQIKELLEKNIESLKNNLTNQGVNVGNVNVKVEETSKSAFNQFDFNQGQFNNESNNNKQNQTNKTSDEGYKLDSKTESSNEESISADGKIENTNAIHAGMVDYKV